MARSLGVAYTERQPYYFISYNSEDEKKVTMYAKELENLGVPMWYDNGIKVGTEWENEIADRIENCQAVIMFLSKNIFLKDKSYVHNEFELATKYSRKKVYIMMLDDVPENEVPVRFRGWWIQVTRLQCVNTFEYASCEECVRVLADALGFKDVKPAEQDHIKPEKTSQSTVVQKESKPSEPSKKPSKPNSKASDRAMTIGFIVAIASLAFGIYGWFADYLGLSITMYYVIMCAIAFAGSFCFFWGCFEDYSVGDYVAATFLSVIVAVVAAVVVTVIGFVVDFVMFPFF